MKLSKRVRILFFLGSLRSGGKERRLIELLTYLKSEQRYDVKIILTKNKIQYPDFFKLDIPFSVIDKRTRPGYFGVFSKFYRLCHEFNPDIIHTWGRMQTLYSLPAAFLQNRILVNSQITAAPPRRNPLSINYFIDRLNFHFSDIILANSKAGVQSHRPPLKKVRIIYNGVNLNRFDLLPDVAVIREKYGITTPHAIIKVASFTSNKNYRLFLNIAQKVTRIREDITFIGVGDYDSDNTEYRQILSQNEGNPKILFPGKIDDVEALINACTIGVLFTNEAVHGEGISNAVLEYMALGKPVIANDAGGTREVVSHNKNGYLLNNHTDEEIVAMMINLIDDSDKRKDFGDTGQKIISEFFSLHKMGKSFTEVYYELLLKRATQTIHTNHCVVPIKKYSEVLEVSK